MKSFIVGLVITLAVALIPAPSVYISNPKLLYAAAMYKTAIGDPQAALRLVQRAEQPPSSPRAAAFQSLQTACFRCAILTVL